MSASLFSTVRLNLVLTHGMSPAFRDGAHLFRLSNAVGSVPSLSGHGKMSTDGVYCRESREGYKLWQKNMSIITALRPGVLLGAEKFMASWLKSEDEASKLREVNRAA